MVYLSPYFTKNRSGTKYSEHYRPRPHKIRGTENYGAKYLRLKSLKRDRIFVIGVIWRDTE